MAIRKEQHVGDERIKAVVTKRGVAVVYFIGPDGSTTQMTAKELQPQWRRLKVAAELLDDAWVEHEQSITDQKKDAHAHRRRTRRGNASHVPVRSRRGG